MVRSKDSLPRVRSFLRAGWPWMVLALMVFAAIWHAVHVPDDVDDAFPRIVRPTFSPHPPPAYRLAEPGDTIDRIGIYVSSLAIVLSLTGLCHGIDQRRRWLASLSISVAAFWYAANPWPTFDGWHGLAWRTVLDQATPVSQRMALTLAAAGLAWLVYRGLGGHWGDLWREAKARRVAALFAVALVFALARQIEFIDVEPAGYWPRWAFAWALVAFSAALIRLQPPARTLRLSPTILGGVAVWFLMVVAGVELTRYHRPIDRLRVVVPGRIYICAMPTARGLEIANRRHHFKTIINLFPEDTPYRSPRLADEVKFARTHNIHYYRSPADVGSSNDFLDLTLRLAQDPSAWPILVHCHACMDRTPAWVGIYKFVIEGRPLDEILRFIEGHRGSRPQATVTLLYNRVLPRLAPERCMNDPTAALLRRCAEGTTDPYFEQLRAELDDANREVPFRVPQELGTAAADRLPSLTPRR